MNQSHTFKSSSALQTKKFAAELARTIFKMPSQKHAVVLALQGELGAGKTMFAQGFLRGLGIKEKAASPTFIIMREFTIPNRLKIVKSKSQKPYTLNPNRYTLLYHIDAYRIAARDANILGLKKIFRDSKSIVLIEWAENIKSLIPKSAIDINLSHGRNSNERKISPRGIENFCDH